jgi:Tfp pilus assembly protein PilV
VHRSEAGFSLIEIAIAAGLFVVLAFGAFEAIRLFAAGVPHLQARVAAYAALERIAAQLRAEARSATAIWSSAPAAGGATDACVQLDFFAADASGPKFWSYRAFPNHASADAVPGDAFFRIAGTAPIVPCDAAHPGDVALRGLSAAPLLLAIAPDRLAAHLDPYLAVADSPFIAASVPATPPIALGVVDAQGGAIGGGNTTTEVRLENAEASRVVDLVAGVFPSGFTEVLHYTCSERCDVGHDSGAPKTLTSCAIGWRPGWSEYVTWNDFVANPDGSLTAGAGWFIAGTFVFTYSGTRAADGGIDTLVREAAATNWDAARDYAAYPPDRPAADGTSAGSFAPWDVRSEAAAAWYADFAPYVATGERAALAAEEQRCAAVQQQGAAGDFYANG